MRSGQVRPMVLGLLAALAVAGCGPMEAGDGAGSDGTDQLAQGLTQVTGFGSNPGNLLMYTFSPANPSASAPLVVVLHGCNQTAAAMEASGWTAAASARGFHVVYAQQQPANNSTRCFNWFNPGDVARGQGEALSVKQMVDWMKAHASIDGNRVFVTGFSAGGYFTAAMAAVYPDIFAAAAVNAGGPYACATTASAAITCMNGTVTRTAQQWGDLVRNAFPGYTGPRPRVAVWHGTQDTTVQPANLTESVKQWTNVLGADQTADVADTVLGQAHRIYRDAGGADVVETYQVSGMGHAVAVDPQFSFPGGTGCGVAGTYFSDRDICATYYQEAFFGLVSPGGGGGGSTAASFGSVAAEDGYVKANPDGSSPAVGIYSTLAVGRGTDGKLNRAIYSFDTSSIPDGATVLSATLTVAYSSGSGSPWSDPAGNSLVLDVRSGVFGGSASTETADWGAVASAPAVASIAAFTSGSQTSAGFSAAGLSAINKTGKTQVRLRFALDQSLTGYVFLSEGSAATLSVTYQ